MSTATSDKQWTEWTESMFDEGMANLRRLAGIPALAKKAQAVKKGDHLVGYLFHFTKEFLDRDGVSCIESFDANPGFLVKRLVRLVQPGIFRIPAA